MLRALFRITIKQILNLDACKYVEVMHKTTKETQQHINYWGQINKHRNCKIHNLNRLLDEWNK